MTEQTVVEVASSTLIDVVTPSEQFELEITAHGASRHGASATGSDRARERRIRAHLRGMHR